MALAVMRCAGRSLACRGVAAPKRATRSMVVSAFKKGQGGEESSGGGKAEKQHEGAVTKHRKAAPPAPFSSPEALPMRRMLDAMSAMQREMDAMMGTFGLPVADIMPGTLGGFPRSSPLALLDTLAAGDLLPPAVSGRGPRFSRIVPLEVEEDEHKYTVKAEVPGFTKDDVKVMLDPANHLVTITGQRSSVAQSAGGEAEGGDTGAAGTTPTLQSHVSFTRSFSLPQDVDAEQPLKARTEHGILTLELPKSPAKAAPGVKEIPVE